MSQLNPDAKEFVPVSPTRSTASPSYNRDVMDDTLISQSPRRAVVMDINVPSPVEFQCEVKQRPSEVFDESNQKIDDDENSHDLSSQEMMQKLLNGKDVSEIEFRPMSCEKTSGTEQEPDIANNETNPFELKSESNDVINLSQCDFLLKKQDPMSISFYEDQNEKGTEFSTNPFDPNKVQWLPDEMDVEDKEDTYNLNKASPESETQLKNVATESIVFPVNQDKNGVIDISEIAESMQNKMSISPELPIVSYTNENECKLNSMDLANGVYVIEKSSIENLSDKFTDSNMFVDVCETFKSPIVDIQSMEQFSPAGPLSPKSPNPELTGLVSPDITASIKDENISGDISESRSPMLNQRSAAGSPFNDILKSPIQELKNELPHGKSSTNICVDIERILSPEITNSPISSLDQPLECHQALNVEAGLSERSISPETLEDGKNIEPLMELVVDEAATPINVVDPNSIIEIEKIASGILDFTLDDQMSERTNIIDTTLQSKIITGENLNDLIEGTCETLLAPIVTEKNEILSQIEYIYKVENASNILEINTNNTELSDSNKIFENDEQVSENNDNILSVADINGEIFSDVNELTSEEQIFKPKDNETERNTLEENHIQSEVDASANLNTSVVESCVSQSDVNSFLERSVLPDVTSPLSPSEKPDQFHHDHPELWRCVYPLPPQYQVPLEDTKCETIHTEHLTDIVPPSEESQIAEAPVLSSVVQHNNRENTENKASHVQNVDESVEKITSTEEKSENTTTTTTTTITNTTTNAVKAVSSLNTAKPKSNLSAKKPLSIKSTSTTPTKLSSTVRKSTATTTTGTASRLTATKPALSKPKSATTAPVAKTTAPLPKTTAPGKLVQSSPTPAKLASEHKKPLTNVDVAVPPKQLLIKKSSSSTVTSKLSTASTCSSTKTAPNKISSLTAPKLSEKPTRVNSARQTTVNSTGSKPRATTVMPKSSPSSTMSAKTSTGRITTSTTKSATRPVTSNLKSTTTVAAPRPRSTVTTSRSSTKAADMEKQIKDASNKQLSAARTSNTKKTDNKAAVGVKLTSRTTGSKSAITSKKPTELCRTSITKTKITAANVPMNHSGTVNVIQDITTVTVVNTDEPQHTKDNSPINITPAIDNSQLIDLPVPISD